MPQIEGIITKESILRQSIQINAVSHTRCLNVLILLESFPNTKEIKDYFMHNSGRVILDIGYGQSLCAEEEKIKKQKNISLYKKSVIKSFHFVPPSCRI